MESVEIGLQEYKLILDLKFHDSHLQYGRLPDSPLLSKVTSIIIEWINSVPSESRES